MVEIIAEIGISHCGSQEVAKSLALEAIDAGADTIKLQRFNSHPVLRERLSDFIIPDKTYAEIKAMAEDNGRGFLCSAFSPGDVSFVARLGCDVIKIPGGRVYNERLVNAVNDAGLGVYLSAGMANDDFDECKDEIDNLVCLMVCRSMYPTPARFATLRAIYEYGIGSQKRIGYSSHSQILAIPVAAMAAGYSAVEVHYGKLGPDADVALDKAGLEFVCGMKRAMGSEYYMEQSEKALLARILEDDKCVS